LGSWPVGKFLRNAINPAIFNPLKCAIFSTGQKIYFIFCGPLKWSAGGRARSILWQIFGGVLLRGRRPRLLGGPKKHSFHCFNFAGWFGFAGVAAAPQPQQEEKK